MQNKAPLIDAAKLYYFFEKQNLKRFLAESTACHVFTPETVHCNIFVPSLSF